MEPRLIYVLIPVILIGKELQFIYGRTVTAPVNSLNHVANSSIKNTSLVRNRSRENLTYLQFSDLPQSDDPQSPDNYYRSLFEDWIPPYQSLKVLTLESVPSSLCAAVLTSSYYVLQLPDIGMHADIANAQFVLWTAKIENDCFLTVQDCTGSYITTNTSLPSSTRCNSPNSLCCQCRGCERDSFPEYETSCAVLFEQIGCSKCNGFRLVVPFGDEVQTMNPIVDDKVSSLYVAPGCELIIYKDQCFLGEASLATGSLNLPPEWNDAISSYKCICGSNSDSSSTTNRPPSTLVATTPMTTIRPTTPIAELTTELTNMPTTSTTEAPTTTEVTSAEVITTTIGSTRPAFTITTVQPTEPETTTIQSLTTLAPTYSTTIEDATTTAYPTTVEETTTTRPPTTILASTTAKEPTTVKHVTTTQLYETSTDHYNELY